MKLTIATLLLLGSWAAPTVANATLIGSTVDVDFFFPNLATLFCSSGSAVVGAGLEYPAGCSGYGPVSIDITDSQVIVLVDGSFQPGAFNGFVMSILSGPSILSASHNAGLSTMGFTSLAFDAVSVSFNFASQQGGTAVFDIATSSVPEPGTLALLGIGLFGMGLARRRKKV